MSPARGLDVCAHLRRAPLTHTHFVQPRLSCFLEFKASIYILRLLCVYAGLPAPLSIFGSYSWSVPVDFY